MKGKGLGLRQTMSISIATMLLLVTVAYAGDTASDNLGATLDMSNSNPTVNDVQVQNSGTYAPTACTTTAIAIRFNATDANGWDDINLTNTGTNCTVKKGAVTHTLSAGTCTKISNSSSTKALFQCTGTMDYNDLTGSDWAVNCSVVDKSAGTSFNDTATMTYNRLESVNVVAASAAWTGVTMLSVDKAADTNPTVTNNCGNAHFAALNITASDLAGVTTPAQTIAASDFSGNDAAAANGETLANGAPVTIVGGELLIGAGASEDVYLYLEQITTPVGTQSYSATAPWQIMVYSASNTN